MGNTTAYTYFDNGLPATITRSGLANLARRAEQSGGPVSAAGATTRWMRDYG